MGEPDELAVDDLPPYVIEDGRRRFRTSLYRDGPYRTAPRALEPDIDPDIDADVDQNPVFPPVELLGVGTLLGPPPESQVVRLSNFAFLRQVWVPPRDALAAFDAWRARTPVVHAHHSRLVFGADLPCVRPSRPVLGADPMRGVSCRLHVAHWPREVAVEMYLLPWNDFRTAVDLRPRGRRWPTMGVPAGAYFSAGHAILDLVVARLVAS